VRKEKKDRPSTEGYSVLVRGPEGSAECSVPIIEIDNKLVRVVRRRKREREREGYGTA